MKSTVRGGRDFYRQLQEAFAEQVIAIPLYYPLYTYVLRDTIEGVQLGYVATPADRFRGIREWRARHAHRLICFLAPQYLSQQFFSRGPAQGFKLPRAKRVYFFP